MPVTALNNLGKNSYFNDKAKKYNQLSQKSEVCRMGETAIILILTLM
jgi:hypothetical protein